MDYDEIKTNVSKNLTTLRKRAGMTQVEFGEKFSFSDKTISKWESGLSIPDVATLEIIATEFNTTIDDLIKSDGLKNPEDEENTKNKLFNYNALQKGCILILLLAFVWSVAGLGYVFIIEVFKRTLWPIFLWAIPLSSILVSEFNKKVFNSFIVKIVSYSITNWGILIASYYSFLMYNISFTPIFFLGLPLQLLIVLSVFTSKWKGEKPRFIKKSDKPRTQKEDKDNAQVEKENTHHNSDEVLENKLE